MQHAEYPLDPVSAAPNSTGLPAGTPAQAQTKQWTFAGFLYDLSSSVINALVVICVIFTFFFRVVSVDGRSMENTLHHADRLIISDFQYTPARGDIVVIGRETAQEHTLIKRVIAIAGDEIDIDFINHTVRVNGQILNEPYIKEPTQKRGDVNFPLTVPTGCVFVMGDNRNDSFDSRFSAVGCVETNRILGREVRQIPSLTKNK